MAAGQLSYRDDLQHAFISFERSSDTLTQSYDALQRRVALLTNELATARGKIPSTAAAGRMTTVVRALPGGVVVLDADGRVEEYNSAAAELIGTIARGEPWREVVERIVAPRWDDGHDFSLRNGRRVHVATEALSSPPGQVLLITDVSATRRLQDELGRYRRLAAESELAAALAHQIRTPLATAILNLGILRQPNVTSTRVRTLTDGVLSPLKHLERLVEEMLLYARCGGFERVPVRIDELLGRLLGVSAALTSTNRFVIDVVDETQGAAISANPDAIVSALGNLVANAADACAGTGRLEVRASRNGAAELVLDFIDDGPGIDPENAVDIFEPFFSTRSSGTGLGLAILRAVVHAHGGHVEVDCQRDRGAHFSVRLPTTIISPSDQEGPNT